MSHGSSLLVNLAQIDTIAWDENSHLKQGLTLQKFTELSHVLVSPWGEKKGVVDEVLSTMGLSRHITLQLPNVLVAPHTLVNTDLLLTMPRLIATKLAQQESISIFDTPIDVPDYQLNIYWHRLNSSKASHIWLRNIIKELT